MYGNAGNAPCAGRQPEEGQHRKAFQCNGLCIAETVYPAGKRSEQQPAGQEFLPVGNGRCEQTEGQFFTAGMVQRRYCPD